MNRVVGDHMGMLATVMNGLAMRDALHRAYVNARLMSAIPLNGVCDNYSWAEAISLLRNNRVVIFPPVPATVLHHRFRRLPARYRDRSRRGAESHQSGWRILRRSGEKPGCDAV